MSCGTERGGVKNPGGFKREILRSLRSLRMTGEGTFAEVSTRYMSRNRSKRRFDPTAYEASPATPAGAPGRFKSTAARNNNFDHSRALAILFAVYII
jgi:hypothetical protein